MINGLFDIDFRLQKLDQNGDPLVQLNAIVPWEQFRTTFSQLRDKPRKSTAGRKPFDVILMFKILVLQSLYNLSDDQMEYQIADRLSFMRFLNLQLDDRVPDAKTIWLFRDDVTKAELTKTLFEQFDRYLRDNGFAAKKGQIIDASIVSAPKQRNTREENKRIKDGEEIEEWDESKRRQKDTDARWAKKNNVNYYGYKNHVSTDVKYKFIRDYEVTDASVHDSQVFEQLLDPNNSSGGVWADSAYRSEKSLLLLKEHNYYEHLQRKGTRSNQLSEREKQGNHTRSKIRSRVEHIFGIMAMRAGNLLMRCIGLKRTRTKIGLRNLSYNLTNFARLKNAAC